MNGKKTSRLRDKKRAEKGMALVLTVILMTILLFVTGTTAIRTIGQARVTARDVDAVRTFYAAEAATEWAAAELRNLLYNNLAPTQQDLDGLPQPPLTGFTFPVFSIMAQGSRTQQVVTTGDYTGLIGYIQKYRLLCSAASGRRTSQIEQIIEHQFIPLFQFGVFYDEDLEIFPGPQMTFAGRIHTNADLYIGAESGIWCNSYVTAVGDIWHYRKDGGHVDPPGFVNIRDQMGAYQNMWTGSYWLDERQANWETEAIERWGGMVRDGSHDMHTLKLPLPPAEDMHVIVERGVPGDTPDLIDAKYWYKADVRIVDGVMVDSNGTPLSPPAGVCDYVVDAFKDTRENKWMDVVELDIAALVAAGLSPDNGIIYISGAGSQDAVRIRNGSQLPTGGLTIVTDNPLYVKGNYNTVSKKGSALICDAITILSGNWNDGLSNQPLYMRNASTTTVNACIMTGHVETTYGSTYSGGLENLPRFLENWSGVTFTFRGSIIDLWFSREATGPWSYGSYYTAPNRNWGFDTDLLDPANWPPGTPRVHIIERGSWRQIS
ncbi:pilus assembly PilX N-terminal domain-containing protein [bacterium]|nr:pilus assembly PilX N-terminal domain-containing protein [bacterium]